MMLVVHSVEGQFNTIVNVALLKDSGKRVLDILFADTLEPVTTPPSSNAHKDSGPTPRHGNQSGVWPPRSFLRCVGCSLHAGEDLPGPLPSEAGAPH